MALSFIKALPALVGSRNDTWIKVALSVGNQLMVKVYYGTNLLTTLKMPADNAGTVAFNIKRIVQSMGVFPDLLNADIPAFDQSIISACTKMLKGFSVVFDEMNLSGGAVISSQTVDAKVMLAGLNPELAFDTALIVFLRIPALKFLTNRPLSKIIGKDTQEFLYYYNTTANALTVNANYTFKIFYTDGSDSGEIIFGSQIMSTVILPSGYNQLDIDNRRSVGKEVSYWEVYITQGGETTEKRRYELDDRCHPAGRDFLFLNSLGGMDTLQIHMVEEINLDRQSDVVERYVSADTSLISGQYYETEIQTNRRFKASTSQLLAEERLWLQEFFASSKIFEINSGKFLPVRILTGSILIQNKADYLDVNFEYRYRYDDIGYTKP